MKKLISLLAVIIMVVFVGACAPTDTPDYVTQDEFNELQLELNEIQGYLDRMVWVGYMLPETDIDLNGDEVFYVSRLGLEYLVSTEKELLDWSKFPEYIIDEFDEYITVEELGELLVDKYLGINSTINVGNNFDIRAYKPIDMSVDEYIVRVSMLVMELSYYDFYLLDSNWVYIVFNEGASQSMTIRTSLLTTDKYDGSLTPVMFWSGLMDTKVMGISYNIENVETIYAQYILDGTFDGYVLPNYK